MGSPGVPGFLLLLFHMGLSSCFPWRWAGLLADPALGHYGRRKQFKIVPFRGRLRGVVCETPAAGLCTNMQN